MFEDVARGVVEEGLQSWQVGALLQDALQSLLTLEEQQFELETFSSLFVKLLKRLAPIRADLGCSIMDMGYL